MKVQDLGPGGSPGVGEIFSPPGYSRLRLDRWQRAGEAGHVLFLSSPGQGWALPDRRRWELRLNAGLSTSPIEPFFDLVQPSLDLGQALFEEGKPVDTESESDVGPGARTRNGIRRRRFGPR